MAVFRLGIYGYSSFVVDAIHGIVQQVNKYLVKLHRKAIDFLYVAFSINCSPPSGMSLSTLIIAMRSLKSLSRLLVPTEIKLIDRGSQYASYNFANIIKSYGGIVKQSMGRKENYWDNAVAESFFLELESGMGI